MDQDFAKERGVPLLRKRRPYTLGTLGKGNIGRVTHETERIEVEVQGHKETAWFDVTTTGDYNVVLGHPWLRRHNPIIDWRMGTLQQWRCQCYSRQRAQSPGVDITQKQRGSAPNDEVFGATREVTERDELAEPAGLHQGDMSEVLPREYQRFEALFTEKELQHDLPTHKKWDHEIPLQEGTSPVHRPIYRVTEREQEELRNYLEENLKKGYIRPSTSSAGYPVLFVPKKGGQLRMCIDYRQLNGITIKNRYPLPLIEEIQDRFQGAQWFTALDLRGAYNLIRMKEGEEWKTAFKIRYGLYKYLVMPFSLTNALSLF